MKRKYIIPEAELVTCKINVPLLEGSENGTNWGIGGEDPEDPENPIGGGDNPPDPNSDAKHFFNLWEE